MNIRDVEIGKKYYIDDSFGPCTDDCPYGIDSFIICGKEATKFCYKYSPNSHYSYWEEYNTFPADYFLTCEEALISFATKCRHKARINNIKETKQIYNGLADGAEDTLKTLREDIKKGMVLS